MRAVGKGGRVGSRQLAEGRELSDLDSDNPLTGRLLLSGGKWFLVEGTVDEAEDFFGATFPDLSGKRLDS
jgi:hypothetical protein